MSSREAAAAAAAAAAREAAAREAARLSLGEVGAREEAPPRVAHRDEGPLAHGAVRRRRQQRRRPAAQRPAHIRKVPRDAQRPAQLLPVEPHVRRARRFRPAFVPAAALLPRAPPALAQPHTRLAAAAPRRLARRRGTRHVAAAGRRGSVVSEDAAWRAATGVDLGGASSIARLFPGSGATVSGDTESRHRRRAERPSGTGSPHGQAFCGQRRLPSCSSCERSYHSLVPSSNFTLWRPFPDS